MIEKQHHHGHGGNELADARQMHRHVLRPKLTAIWVFLRTSGVLPCVGEQGRPEGMTGTAVVLGGDQSPHSTYIQVGGEAQRIKADELRKAMRASETLNRLLLKYVQVFNVQTTHTAIANTRAHIDRRLARWILMAHDRTRDNTLPLTHEFLALMLGVRRSGVTEALQSLRKQKLIENGRNKIVVLNRKGIEKMAGNSYGVPEKEYRRLIG